MVNEKDIAQFLSIVDAEFMVIHFLPGSGNPRYQGFKEFFEKEGLLGCTNKLGKFIEQKFPLDNLKAQVRIISSMTPEDERIVKQQGERPYDVPNNTSMFMILSDLIGKYTQYCSPKHPPKILSKNLGIVYSPHSMIFAKESYDEKNYTWKGRMIKVLSSEEQLSFDIPNFISEYSKAIKVKEDKPKEVTSIRAAL